MIQYGDFGDELLNLFKVSKGQASVVVDFAALPEVGGKPNFWSDHHHSKKEQLDLHKKLKAGGAIGKTEFKSDTEHMATSHAQNIAGFDTIKAITGIDSAKYSDLVNTLDLPTEFKKKGRNERLAIIINSLLSELIKRNPKAINALLRRTEPSLVSLYTNLIKVRKLHDKQVEALAEFKKKEPDWNKIHKIRSGLPLEMAKEVRTVGKKKADVFGKEKYAKEFTDQITAELGKKKPDWKRIVKIAEEMPRRIKSCLLYTSPSPRDGLLSRMPSSA